MGFGVSQRVCAFVAVWLLLAFLHQRKSDSATSALRLDLLHSLVLERTVRIDAYHQNTPDKAVWKGHYYSDKAPGTVTLALPAFAVAAEALKMANVPLDSETGWLLSSWVACAGSIGIITALGGVATFAWLCRWVPPRRALVTTLALFLGAAPLPYATMMFSHALVVGLLAIAIWAAFQKSEDGGQEVEASKGKTERGTGKEGGRAGRFLGEYLWVLLAGFACGWALASEYSAGLVVVGILLWLVLVAPAAKTVVRENPAPGPPGAGLPSPPLRREGTRHSLWLDGVVSRLNGRRALAFCVAATLPLLLIPAYSWACFGDPFTLPYSHQASFPAMKEGLYAIQWPDSATAFNLLFSPTRGLFFWTPFLLMAGFGYGALFERAPRMFWLTYLVPLLQIAVLSGRMWDWQAGPTLGPRLLAPMLPLLALPCAMGIMRWPRLGMVLAFCSILITTVATLTDACPSGEIYSPLTELHIPLLLRGQFSPNLGLVLGLPPYAAVALYYLILIAGFWWLWRLCGEPEPKVRQG